MKNDVLVYISGPITAVDGRIIEEHVARAAKVFINLVKSGIPAFCPHLTALLPTAFTIPYPKWIAYDLAIIDRCTHMLMLDDWRESKGALKEQEYASKKGIPIYESIGDLLEDLK